jgi:hypothetical protein
MIFLVVHLVILLSNLRQYRSPVLQYSSVKKIEHINKLFFLFTGSQRQEAEAKRDFIDKFVPVAIGA